MKSWRLLFILLLLSGGCGDSEKKIRVEDFAEKYQLQRTHQFDRQFEGAILYANAALSPNFPYRLMPTWPVGVLSPVYNFVSSAEQGKSFRTAPLNDSVYHCSYINYQPVPIYLVDDDKLAASENIFIPDNDRCVFVNTRFIDTLWKDFGIERLEPDRRHTMVLSLILLHEMGHLSPVNPVSATGLFHQLQQNREYQADSFAAGQIQQLKTATDKGSFSETFLRVSPDFLAGDLYRALTYGRSEFEVNRDILGFFNGRHTFLNFQSKADTHPNLYLRFLLMNYALTRDSGILTIIMENHRY